MRLLPVLTVVIASLLSVACSNPVPPAGVTVVSPFESQRFLGFGMKSPASIIISKAGWKRLPRLTVCAAMAA